MYCSLLAASKAQVLVYKKARTYCSQKVRAFFMHAQLGLRGNMIYSHILSNSIIIGRSASKRHALNPHDAGCIPY